MFFFLIWDLLYIYTIYYIYRITRTLYKISFLYVCIQFFIVIIKQISIMSAFGKKLK